MDDEQGIVQDIFKSGLLGMAIGAAYGAISHIASKKTRNELKDLARLANTDCAALEGSPDLVSTLLVLGKYRHLDEKNFTDIVHGCNYACKLERAIYEKLGKEDPADSNWIVLVHEWYMIVHAHLKVFEKHIEDAYASGELGGDGILREESDRGPADPQEILEMCENIRETIHVIYKGIHKKVMGSRKFVTSQPNFGAAVQ